MTALAEEAGFRERDTERLRFLAGTEWRSAGIVRLGSDASIRQYFRLEGGPAPALLMDAPSAATEPPCPPAADEAERIRLGYGAMVRGSGSSILAYDAAARLLTERGLLVPQVLASDPEAGFAIVSDLGGEHVADSAARPAEESALYDRAADILDRLRSAPAEAGDVHGWTFQTYDRLAYETEAMLLSEWYLPKIAGRTVTDADEERLRSAWWRAFEGLSAPQFLVHRDFHAENLMVTPQGIGVLDFQDLMVGQAAYDWVSLLEDARRDIGEGIRERIYERGCEGAPDRAAFERDYAVLAAQRNAKILGLFARLAHRDGKKRYLSLTPRVEGFFREDLRRAPLAPVREVLADMAPELVDG